jgi:GxxExxY protein
MRFLQASTRMLAPLENINQITSPVVKCAIEVHRQLGAGLLESVYRCCLIYELRTAGISIEANKSIPIVYKGIRMDKGLEIDLKVDGRVLVELKSVEKIMPVHHAQLMTYMKLAGCPAGTASELQRARDEGWRQTPD